MKVKLSILLIACILLGIAAMPVHTSLAYSEDPLAMKDLQEFGAVPSEAEETVAEEIVQISETEPIVAETIPQETVGERIDAYLASELDMSRSSIVSMLENGEILVNDKIVKKNYKTIGGEKITVFEREIVPLDAVPENIPLDIVYEDEDLLVINKAVGMVVHPAAGNESGTLVNALLYYCGDTLSGINGVQRPGIVHRLDKDTSGLMLVAKNDMAHASLAEQIKEHSAYRTYQAVIHGHLKEAEGSVDAPIGRHKTDRKKMAVTYENAREAVTHYKVLCEYPGFSHIECRLRFGRTLCIWMVKK